MKMMRIAIIGLVVASSLGSTAWSQSAESKGYAIAKAASDQDKNYKDYSATGNMTLKNKAGSTAVRKFDYKSMESGGRELSLLVFNWPGDIRDTGLLTHTNKSGGDSQWVFLPAQRRVKRIAGATRSGSFVGSEFAYEDMVEQELDKYSYKWLKDTDCCHIVERKPKESSGYAKQVVWFNKANNTVSKVEFYNRGGSLLKVLTISSYKKYNGRFWRPSTMVMVNRLTGKQTILSWSNHRFGVGLTANAFTTRALERAR